MKILPISKVSRFSSQSKCIDHDCDNKVSYVLDYGSIQYPICEQCLKQLSENLNQLLVNETKHTSVDAYTKIEEVIKNERLPEDNKETECWEEYYQGWCGY